jgi:hypothetical protein
MNKIIIVIMLLIINIYNIYSVNNFRYLNEKEVQINGVFVASNIIKYDLTIDIITNMTFETKDSTSDTLMYLWSNADHKQVAKDDNGGTGLNSKISIKLYPFDSITPASYSLFIISKNTIELAPDNLTITNQTINDTRSYSALNEIKILNSQINNNGNVHLKAGNKIDIKPGFRSVNGSYLRAYNESINNLIPKCSLYINGIKVLSDRLFSCTKVDVGNHPIETKFRYKNMSDGERICGILLNKTDDIIGYDDTSNCYIEAAEIPSFIILGTLNNTTQSNCSCNVWYTENRNLDYLALYGTEDSKSQFRKNSVKSFVSELDKSSNYNHALASRDTFFGDDRLNYIDSVEFMLFFGHGDEHNYGSILMENGKWIDIASPETNCGVGNRINNRCGSLDYATFMSCRTVHIESTSNGQWLIDRGWCTGYDSNHIFNKGFFDGVHMVIGYNWDHTIYDETIFYSSSSEIILANYANYMDFDYSIWDSWKYANIIATEDFHFYMPFKHPLDLGEISSIYVLANKDEKISDFKNKSYKYGDPDYHFGARLYHYWYK